MDQVRGVWTRQDRRLEEHSKASESGMVVITEPEPEPKKRNGPAAAVPMS